MTSKQKYMNDMNALTDAINALAGTTGKKTIVQLVAIVQGLIPQSRSVPADANEGSSEEPNEEPEQEK